MSDSASDSDSQTEEQENKVTKIFLPGDKIEEEEELTYDPDAYKIFHQFGVGCSCLSFDIIPNNDLNNIMIDGELSISLVSGTQSPSSSNKIIISQINQIIMNKDEDDEGKDEGTDVEKQLPKLVMMGFKHVGNVNRVKRQCISGHEIVASWSDTGSVYLWDIHSELSKLHLNLGITSKESKGNNNKTPLFQFSHKNEGYALAWSPVTPGRLASGDCDGCIYIWEPLGDGSWSVGSNKLFANKHSIEDLQWSPKEKDILASCGCDGNVRIWDCRVGTSNPCVANVKASTSDINVLAWANNDPYIISGDDTGLIQVWDIRKFSEMNCQHVAYFKHHSKAITSLEFHPFDSTVFASSGEDDQVCQWDLSAEMDDKTNENNIDLPPQLLFIHLGQNQVKEVHWHPQIPGLLVTVDVEYFNIFKSISV